MKIRKQKLRFFGMVGVRQSHANFCEWRIAGYHRDANGHSFFRFKKEPVTVESWWPW